MSGDEHSAAYIRCTGVYLRCIKINYTYSPTMEKGSMYEINSRQIETKFYYRTCAVKRYILHLFICNRNFYIQSWYYKIQVYRYYRGRNIIYLYFYSTKSELRHKTEASFVLIDTNAWLFMLFAIRKSRRI